MDDTANTIDIDDISSTKLDTEVKGMSKTSSGPMPVPRWRISR